MGWLGGVIGNLIGIGGQAAANIGTATVGTRKQLKYTKQMSDYTYSKDLDMWNRMNQYNLPISQMQRLDEAGLNPNMMYGTGQGANVAKEMPKYTNPSVSYDLPALNVMGILSAFQDIKVKQAQADNIKEQTETRRLDNNLKSSTLLDMINQVKSKTVSAEARANLDRIAEYVEYQFQGLNEGEVSFDQQMRGTQKRIAELGISQQAVRRTAAEADLKQAEAEIYKLGKSVNIGSDVLQGIMNVFRAMVLKK